MFDQKSDHALNKRSPNIVYRQADGSCLEVRPEDCPDFDRWKAFSNEDFHALDLHDWHETRGRLSLNDLTDEDVDPLPSVEDAAELDEPPSPDPRTTENAMAILNRCLTETQRRRYLLYTRDGKSTRQIAQAEGVSQRTIMESLHESARKLKNFSEKG